MLVSLSDSVAQVESSVEYFQRTTEAYLKDGYVFYMTGKFSKTQIICLEIPILYVLPCDLATTTPKASWERKVARQ